MEPSFCWWVVGSYQFERRRLFFFLTHIHPYLGHDRIHHNVNELSSVECVWIGINTSFKTHKGMDIAFLSLIAIMEQIEQIGRIIPPLKGGKGEKEEWLSRKLNVYVYKSDLRPRSMDASWQKSYVSDLDRREWESLTFSSQSYFVRACLAVTNKSGRRNRFDLSSYVLSDVWVVSKPSGGNVPFWPFANNLWERKRRERKGKVYWR